MRIRTVVTGLACLATAALPPAPAHAAQVMLIQGAGTQSPGLDVIVPRPQTMTFTGTATVLGATYPCAFAGPIAFENAAGGAGVLTGGCGPVNVSCLYERVGPAVALECSSPGVGVYAGAFVYTPNTVNPTTSYTLVGVLAGDG